MANIQHFFKQELAHCEPMRFDPCDYQESPLVKQGLAALSEEQRSQVHAEMEACKGKCATAFTESNGQMELKALL